MAIEQIVRCEETSEPMSSPTEPLDDTKTTKPKRGRPKGIRNKNKKEAVFSDILKQLQTIFKDAKQHWGMQDFMNVNETLINNAVNLSMFMTNVSAKLMENYRCQITDYSIIDLKSHYRGLMYMIETLKYFRKNLKILLLNKLLDT